MIMRFPLHCPGPGYWLLSRRVVPPPQSDHWKQLLSGEYPHPIRHEIDTTTFMESAYMHTNKQWRYHE